VRNLLICIGMSSRTNALQIKMPRCQCQLNGRLPVFWRTKRIVLGAGALRERCDESPFDYAKPRAIPSLCILNWRVDRFIPRCAAAPWGPATTQLLCFRASRIC